MNPYCASATALARCRRVGHFGVEHGIAFEVARGIADAASGEERHDDRRFQKPDRHVEAVLLAGRRQDVQVRGREAQELLKLPGRRGWISAFARAGRVRDHETQGPRRPGDVRLDDFDPIESAGCMREPSSDLGQRRLAIGRREHIGCWRRAVGIRGT